MLLLMLVFVMRHETETEMAEIIAIRVGTIEIARGNIHRYTVCSQKILFVFRQKKEKTLCTKREKARADFLRKP